MSQVLDWIKSNVLIVVFVALMIGALVSMPFVASSMNASVRDDVQARARLKGQLDALKVSVPDEDGSERLTYVNDDLLREYQAAVELMKADAEQVRAAAVALNRKGRDVLDPQFLPAPPPHLRLEKPGVFHGLLLTAFEALLGEVGAGSPPDSAAMVAEINHERSAFLAQSLQKDESDELTEEERQRLDAQLASKRRTKYAEAARQVSFYADKSLFTLPSWDLQTMPEWPLGAWYNHQWELWICEDILKGLHAANESNADDQTVAHAPVKRVLGISVWLRSTGSGNAATSGRPPQGRSGGAATMGGDSSDSDEDFDADRPAAGSGARGLPSWKAATPVDYGSSLTGRVTNPLYDVVLVDVQLVLSTDRIPAVLNSLCKQNFFTVLDMDLRPRDSYADLREGFYYGSDPVSEVHIQLETIWLREWMIPLMPDDTKQMLGIPLQKKSQPGSGGEPDDTIG